MIECLLVYPIKYTCLQSLSNGQFDQHFLVSWAKRLYLSGWIMCEKEVKVALTLTGRLVPNDCK